MLIVEENPKGNEEVWLRSLGYYVGLHIKPELVWCLFLWTSQIHTISLEDFKKKYSEIKETLNLGITRNSIIFYNIFIYIYYYCSPKKKTEEPLNVED